MTTARTPQARKHLMVPGQPRPPSRPGAMSTPQVQRWIYTVLTVALVGHLAEALVLFALAVPDGHRSSTIGLLVIAGVVGLLAAAGVRAIHHRRLMSSWLLVGWGPAAAGTLVAYLR